MIGEAPLDEAPSAASDKTGDNPRGQGRNPQGLQGPVHGRGQVCRGIDQGPVKVKNYSFYSWTVSHAKDGILHGNEGTG